VEESMSFFLRIVRFIFWLLVVSWSVALLRGVIGWMLRGAAGKPMQGTGELGGAQASDTIRHLVRDPVCGTHVAEDVAIALEEGNELVHFCSPACRDAYAGVAPKLAANG
jgi:hypothetical protein